MRKTIDTMLLILLLVGPSIILTCVRQPASEEKKITQTEQMNETAQDDATVLYADMEVARP